MTNGVVTCATCLREALEQKRTDEEVFLVDVENVTPTDYYTAKQAVEPHIKVEPTHTSFVLMIPVRHEDPEVIPFAISGK